MNCPLKGKKLVLTVEGQLNQNITNKNQLITNWIANTNQTITKLIMIMIMIMIMNLFLYLLKMGCNVVQARPPRPRPKHGETILKHTRMTSLAHIPKSRTTQPGSRSKSVYGNGQTSTSRKRSKRLTSISGPRKLAGKIRNHHAQKKSTGRQRFETLSG